MKIINLSAQLHGERINKVKTKEELLELLKDYKGILVKEMPNLRIERHTKYI